MMVLTDRPSAYLRDIPRAGRVAGVVVDRRGDRSEWFVRRKALASRLLE